MPDSVKITLTFSELNQGAGDNDNYKVYRASGQDPCPNGIINSSNLIDTQTSTAGGIFTYVDNTVSINTSYFYRLSTVRGNEEALGNLIGPLVSNNSNELAYPGGANDNAGSPYYVTEQPLLHINAEHEYKKHSELIYGLDTERTIENMGKLPDLIAHTSAINGTVKLDDGFGSGHSSFVGNANYATNLPMLTSSHNWGAYFTNHQGSQDYHLGDYNQAAKKQSSIQNIYLDRGYTFFIVYKGWPSTSGYWNFGSNWSHGTLNSFSKESDGEPWYLGQGTGDYQYSLIGDGTDSETWNNFNNTDINGSNQVIKANSNTFRNGYFRTHPGGNDSWAPPSTTSASLGRYATPDGSAGVGRQADGHIAYAGGYAQIGYAYPNGYSFNDEWKTKWHVIAYTTSPNSLAQGGGSAIGAWFDGNMFTDFHNAYNYFPYNGTGLTNIFDSNTNSLSCSQANFPTDATKDWRNLQANLTSKYSTVGEHIMRQRPVDALPTNFIYGSNGVSPGLAMCIGDMMVFPSTLNQSDFMSVIDYINNKYAGHLFNQGTDYVPTASHPNAWFTKA